MTLISAHRFGAGENPELENTSAALQAALATPADYVEFDVQRCADGTFVIDHDGVVERDGLQVPISDLTVEQFTQLAAASLLYTEVLNLLRGHKQAHIDLKFGSPAPLYATPAETYEVEVARIALELLGEGNFIITAGGVAGVRTLRDWADEQGIELLVGLSLGRGLRGLTPLEMIRVRHSELFPARLYAASRANLMVVHHRLARARVARWAHREGLPVLVWTVDGERNLRRWLADPRVWMVTTNFPSRAAELLRTMKAR